MNPEIIVLRLVHILGGIFWVGSGIFTAFFLIPALAGVGPAAGQVMEGLQRRRLFTVLPVVALLTILSGIRLMMIASAGFGAGYFASTAGRTYAASGVAAIIAFVLSIFIARPAAVRAASLAPAIAGAPDESARAALVRQLESARRRSAVSSTIAVVLLLISAAGMATARYLG